ncbi:MAG TPA: prepilin peptidase [Opitutaceae bacterium]|nr:prepilin peptidase [Opitutaceae bacterium]
MMTLEDLRLVQENFPWFFPAAAAVFGACIGSFLNVCIYRIPAGQSVVRPGSHCACGQPVRWFDNIPILSWLVLRGRARCCGRPFSVRYPAVELLTALVFLVCALEFGPGKALCAMLFASMLIAASFIDIDHMIIPDRFSIGGAVVGVVLSALVPALHGHAIPGSADPTLGYMLAGMQSGIDALLGMFVGSALVLWIALIAEKILRKEAMGFGDVKLLGCIGAFVGWKGAVFAVFGGAILGVVATLVWLPFRRSAPESAEEKPAAKPAPAASPATAIEGEEPSGEESPGLMGMPVPFGPMLSAAGLLYLLWAHPYVDEYFGQIAAVLDEFARMPL